MEAISFTEISNANKVPAAKPALHFIRTNFDGEDFKDKIIPISEVIKIKYTIKAGDDKRIDKRGVLKVYNIKNPVEIPVMQLLGKWKNSHIGTTIFRIDDEWQVEGSQIQQIIHQKKPHASIVKRLIIKYKTVNTLDRFFNKRISEDNIFKNA